MPSPAQFNRDGRAAIYLAHNPGDLPYNEARSACVGEWRTRAPRTFDVTLNCLWGTSWETAPPVCDLWIEGKYEAWDTWGEVEGKRLGIAPLP